MSFKTPRGLASGLGSSGTGTHHWWVHRITSVALLPLTILAIIPFASAFGADHDEVLEIYRNPFNAIVASLWIGVTFHHLMQGLQVVIEDYVHAKGRRTVLLLANSMFCVAFGFAGIFAVMKIAFTG